ncbi:MAG: hypothetical protein AB7N76_10080 [Planctomycetota bacterium]
MSQRDQRDPAGDEAEAPETEAPEAEAPEDAAPEDAAPGAEAPEDAAPGAEAPEDAAPEDAAPEDAAPEDAAPEDARQRPTAARTPPSGAVTPLAAAETRGPTVATSSAAPAPAPVAPASSRAAAQVAFACALSLALLGFVTGVGQSRAAAPRQHALPAPRERPEQFPVAPTYSAMHAVALGPNAGWTTTLATLPQMTPDLLAPCERAAPAAKELALELRAERRAYAGAPPVIPHQVAARSAAACLACHAQGLRVGERVASPMPHRLLVNCLQCHAPPAPGALAGVSAGVPASAFRGQAEPREGARAWPGAPPVIPHDTAMRERCEACHGPGGSAPALGTTHPWRLNCRQCHAPATAGFAR